MQREGFERDLNTVLPVKNNFNIKKNILHVSIIPSYNGLPKRGFAQ
jgi:hypothetical protein